MTKLDLSGDEKKRLAKIGDAFGWRVSVSVKEHFNKVGKFQDFAMASTPAEEAEQRQAMKGLFSMSEAQASFATLKATDVFMRVARRVGTDQEIAELLPKGVFDTKDAELLEKCELKSLAALVRTRVAK